MNWMVCIKKNIKALLVTSKDSGLEANTEKSKYIFLSREQNVGQNHTIRHINTLRTGYLNCLNARSQGFYHVNYNIY